MGIGGDGMNIYLVIRRYVSVGNGIVEEPLKAYVAPEKAREFAGNYKGENEEDWCNIQVIELEE